MARTAVNSSQGVVVGPYSQGMEAGNLLFLSGTPPLVAGGKLVDGGIQAQTRQTLDNLGAVLDAAGLSFDDVVKCTVYLSDLADYAEMNAVYETYFTTPYPARTTLGAGSLELDALIVMEMVALRR